LNNLAYILVKKGNSNYFGFKTRYYTTHSRNTRDE